jgi:hypothetical protein
MKFYRNHVLVGISEMALNAGVEDFLKALRQELAKADLAEEINILETGPLGFFGKGICITVYPKTQLLRSQDRRHPELVSEHFLKGARKPSDSETGAKLAPSSTMNPYRFAQFVS